MHEGGKREPQKMPETLHVACLKLDKAPPVLDFELLKSMVKNHRQQQGVPRKHLCTISVHMYVYISKMVMFIFIDIPFLCLVS